MLMISVNALFRESILAIVRKIIQDTIMIQKYVKFVKLELNLVHMTILNAFHALRINFIILLRIVVKLVLQIQSLIHKISSDV